MTGSRGAQVTDAQIDTAIDQLLSRQWPTHGLWTVTVADVRRALDPGLDFDAFDAFDTLVRLAERIRRRLDAHTRLDSHVWVVRP